MGTIKRQLVGDTPHRFEGTNPARYITVHETGNTSPGAGAQAHADLQSRGNPAEVSWHWSVDDSIAIQSFTHDVRCWHAGDNRGDGNMSSIAVEVCVNPESDYEQAMALAAALVAQIMAEENIPLKNVVQHNHWAGKDCPHYLRAESKGVSWSQFLADVQTVATPRKDDKVARMTSPARGKVSSEYGWRPAIPGVAPAMVHAGIDIANKVGTPIYAAYAGKVVGAGSNGVPGRSGKYVLIANPDGERQYYGHLNKIRVKVGQQIKQGQRIGDMGATGNVTGPHLHFEVWGNSNPNSARDPRLDFVAHGVVPGSKPRGTSAAPKPPKPKPKPSGPGSRLSPREVGNVQRALAVMGYDVGPADQDYGDRTTRAVVAYQRDLNKFAGAGLVEDGDWWTVVQRWFDWAKQLQRVLPAWRGVPRLVVDGGYQQRTHNAVRILQSNNPPLVVDGKAQAKTCAYMRRHGSNISNPPRNRP